MLIVFALGVMTMPKTEVLIIGCGVAALALAEKVRHVKETLILTKKTRYQTNSALAQGGIATAISPDDSWEYHLNDTLMAGCHLNNEEATCAMVKNGTKQINDWIDKGFSFDKDCHGNFRLGKEGAHQKRRVLHAGGDQTGLHMTTVMQELVMENVPIIEHHTVIDFIVEDGICLGAEVCNAKGEITNYYADYTVLATGGIGGLFQTTSNDKSIVGDGLALAYRAGCEMKDLEFIQFHPTLLYLNGQGCGLISEAVRGEGATLITKTGKKIMEHVHPLQELAPRDIVAREIQSYLKKDKAIFLDISKMTHFQERFPAISEQCQKNGVDIRCGKIPVAPGAHFHMGGVKVDLHGQTSVKNLFAVGEVCCQGVHGANRLASNSLLECLVFGGIVGESLAFKHKPTYPKIHTLKPKQDALTLALPTIQEVQSMMSQHVGIVRNRFDLKSVIDWFESYGVGCLTLRGSQLVLEQLEIWNLMTAGWLIARAAFERKESVGAHYIQT